MKYKVLPKIDQKEVFTNVFQRLNEGGCIGIFPEGGSHDQTKLLPIKPGVAIMALGAMEKNPDVPVTIVACGLKYFKPYKFRSQVVIEFSEPYTIERELAEEFKVSKRDACSKLMTKIERRMNEVMLTAENYEELQAIILARRFYLHKNDEGKYSIEDIDTLYKRFSKGFAAMRHE